MDIQIRKADRWTNKRKKTFCGEMKRRFFMYVLYMQSLYFWCNFQVFTVHPSPIYFIFQDHLQSGRWLTPFHTHVCTLVLFFIIVFVCFNAYFGCSIVCSRVFICNYCLNYCFYFSPVSMFVYCKC